MFKHASGELSGNSSRQVDAVADVHADRGCRGAVVAFSIGEVKRVVRVSPEDATVATARVRKSSPVVDFDMV